MVERVKRDGDSEDETPPDSERKASDKDKSATPEDDGTLGLSQL